MCCFNTLCCTTTTHATHVTYACDRSPNTLCTITHTLPQQSMLCIPSPPHTHPKNRHTGRAVCTRNKHATITRVHVRTGCRSLPHFGCHTGTDAWLVRRPQVCGVTWDQCVALVEATASTVSSKQQQAVCGQGRAGQRAVHTAGSCLLCLLAGHTVIQAHGWSIVILWCMHDV